MKVSHSFLSRAAKLLCSRGGGSAARLQWRAPIAAASAITVATTELSVAAPSLRSLRIATFSSSSDDASHDDFAPKRKAVGGQDEAIQMIQEHVDANPIMLYMKGSPNMPMCGFSARVVQALQAEGVDFASVNVLDYPSIREGIKKFSDWPTIPQLYVNGEFVGGCDIVMSMAESGELTDLFKDLKPQQD